MNQKFRLATFLFFTICQVFAQKTDQFSLEKLPIENWQITDSKWQNAAQVFVHPFDQKKNKISVGNQILLGQNAAGMLSSTLKTGDVKVKFQYMLGQNTASVFYLQGRYGLDLSNGNILKTDGNTLKPYQNATKAIGLWQNIEISFDIEEKTSIATIEKVVLNGLTIHENYVMNQASQKAPNQTKGNEGSFVFVSNLGIIAIKNFEYAAYTSIKPLSINDLSYEFFETYSWDRQFGNKTEKSEKGKSEALTYDLGIPHQNYLLVYKGNLNAEKEGIYALTLDYAGKCAMSVNGKLLQDNAEENYRQARTHTVDLKKGANVFEIRYNKIWWKPALGLLASGTGIKPYPLHGMSSLPEPTPTNSISVEPTDEVEMIRSFMIFEGKKRTNIISVGSPVGVHYAFDLAQGALLTAWKGEFANTTDMWHERGEPQVLKAKGLINQFSGKPMIGQLKDVSEAMPDSLNTENQLVYKNYQLDSQGFPTYNYELSGTKISQKYTAENNNLICTFQGNGQNLFAKIADGKNISQIDKGLYLVDNHYVRLDPKAKPLIRNSKTGQELIIGLNGTVSFSVIW